MRAMRTLTLSCAALLMICAEARATAPNGGDTVTLVSAGKGKKARLAFAFHAGDVRTLDVVFTVTADMGGRTITTPTVSLKIKGEVVTVNKDGSAHVRMTIRDVASVGDDGKPAAVPAAFQPLSGASMEVDILPDGEEGPGTVTGNADLGPLLTTVIGTPLPPDPIGDGAEWTLTHATVASGIHADATDGYRLSGRAAGKAHIAMSMTMTGPKQHVEQGGQGFDVDHFSSKATGTAVLDPSSFLVASTSRTTTEMEVTVGGKKTSVVTHVSVVGTLE